VVATPLTVTKPAANGHAAGPNKNDLFARRSSAPNNPPKNWSSPSTSPTNRTSAPTSTWKAPPKPAPVQNHPTNSWKPAPPPPVATPKPVSTSSWKPQAEFKIIYRTGMANLTRDS